MSKPSECIALEACPYFWKAGTINNFLRETFNIIKPVVKCLHQPETTPLVHESETTKIGETHSENVLKSFVGKVNSESEKVLGDRNLVDIIGSCDWDILKRNELGHDTMKIDNDKFRKRSVIDLLRLIRNKMEHCRGYKSEVKEKLPFFVKVENIEPVQYKFDQQLYASYWITKFPKLLPFLWVKFYEFRNILKSYYPVHYSEAANDFSLMPVIHPSDLIIDLNKFLDYLNRALIVHLGKGTVLKRFKENNIDGFFKRRQCSLEFRAFHGLLNMLERTTCITVVITPGEKTSLTVSHITSKDQIEYIGHSSATEKMILIFTENIESELEDVWGDCQNCDCRVIVFGDEEKLKDEKILIALGNFKEKNANIELYEYPITCSDLSRSTIEKIYENGKVSIFGRDSKVKDILFDFNVDNLLDGFSGDFLNNLLRGKKPSLFHEFDKPTVYPDYVERTLYVNDYLIISLENIDEYFWNSFGNDFVVILCGTVHLSKKQITNLKLNQSNCQKVYFLKEFNDLYYYDPQTELQNGCIIVVESENDDELSGEVMQTDLFLNCVSRSHIHYMRFDKHCTLFYRINDFTELDILKNKIPDNEIDIIKTLSESNEKAVFITSEPGGGKTHLLQSISQKLLEKGELSIYVPMKRFIGLVDIETKTTQEQVKQVIQLILKCDSDQYKLFLHQWLDQQNVSYEVGYIHLMLDGLDEVPIEKMDLAIEILKTIQSHFKIVKLWVTSREAFADEIGDFTYDSVKILPFTNDKQREFFVRYFQYNASLTELDATKVAEMCISHFWREVDGSFQTNITTTPLHCFMLANFYNGNMDTLSLSDESFVSLDKVQLFEWLLKHKINTYIKSKLKITVDENDPFYQQAEDCLFELQMYIALESCFPGKFKQPKETKRYNESHYLKMGIVKCAKPVIFVHKTFAEYLISKFIFRELNTQVDMNRLETMHSFLSTVFSLSKYKLSFNYTVICSFLNEMLSGFEIISLPFMSVYAKAGWSHTKIEKRFDYFDRLFYKAYPYVFILVHILRSGSLTDEFQCKAFITAMEDIDSKFDLYAFKKLCGVFGLDKNGMDITNSYQYHIFESALKTGHFDIIKYIIETKMWFPPSSWHMISDKRENGGGILHIILHPNWRLQNIYERKYLGNFISLLAFLKNTEDIYMANTTNYVKMTNVLDNQGKTALMNLPLFSVNDEYSNVRSFLINELYSGVNEVFAGAENAQYFIDDIQMRHWYWCESKDIQDFHKTLQVFLKHGYNPVYSKTQKDGWTALACAVHYYSCKLPIETLMLLKSAQFDFNAKDNEGNSILHFCVETCSGTDATLAIPLIIFGCDISVRNDKGQCAMCLAMDLKNVEMCDLLWRIMNLLKKKPCNENCRLKLDAILKDLSYFRGEFLKKFMNRMFKGLKYSSTKRKQKSRSMDCGFLNEYRQAL